jgi:L-alanine-DL-glutamate epimerase-like enolase superfamily enzyme
MRITNVSTYVLLDPDVDPAASSSAQDDFVVEIETDEGVSGIGESDLNPWIGRACVEARSTHSMGLGLRDMLVGEDPLDIAGLWNKMYVGSAMNGRRGALIHAMGALDIALHDLKGKALGKPCHELLGTVAQPAIRPYASLQPDCSSFEDYRDSIVSWALRAKALGFSAVKTEVTLDGPYAHLGLRESWDRSTEVVTAVRAAIGPDIHLLVDVQYAFPDVTTALAVLADWQDLNLAFVETPLWPDDLAGYARLAAEQPIPIAAGEWLATRFEFLDLMDRGHVTYAQPDMGRVGGLTEAMRVAALAAERGVLLTPHVWKTGISIAAAVHFAAVNPHCRYVEYLPADLSGSTLRKELTTEDLSLADGCITLPSKPGLGIEINRDALERWSVDE